MRDAAQAHAFDSIGAGGMLPAVMAAQGLRDAALAVCATAQPAGAFVRGAG